MSLVHYMESCNSASRCAETPNGPAADVTLAESLRRKADEAWRVQMARCWSSKTSLVYDCPPTGVRPAREFDDGPGYFRFQRGVAGKDTYGAGMGDCALVGGVALAGLCDRWSVLHDAESADMAVKIARGLLNLTTAHGFPGFVARGLCEEDGRSICALSSRDQYTHWLHGLWRFVSSGMAQPQFRREFRQALVTVAGFLESRCTPARGWNFGMADGSDDPLGICTMWGPDLHPHEFARLPMFFLAAWAETGDTRWRDQYERFADEAIANSLRMEDPANVSGIPCYSLLQANCSLELLLALEASSDRKTRIGMAMEAVAAEARRRIDVELHDHSRRFYGMCDDGELALASLLAQSDDARILPFIELAVGRDETGPCRAAHLLAACWRLRLRRVGSG